MASIPAIVKIQSQLRGYMARQKYGATMQHYKANRDKIVMLQSAIKGRQTKKAYQSLNDVDNIQANALHSFVHLMDDSDKDFQEELELENLKQSVIRKIRENN